MSKIAYFACGCSEDNLLSKIKNVISIPICVAPKTNFFRFDCLIISSSINEDIMSQIEKRLSKFVEWGGVIIIFGAEGPKNDWIPFCNYRSPYINDILFINKDLNPAKELFAGLELEVDHFKYHDKFIAHGSILPDHSEGWTPFIVSKKNPNHFIFALMALPGGTGRMLVTTLDPDRHATKGYSKNLMPDNPEAHRLYENIIQWAQNYTVNEHASLKFVRRLIGITKYSAIAFLEGLLVLIGIGSLSLYLLHRIKPNELGIIGSISSVLSVMLFFIYRKKNG